MIVTASKPPQIQEQSPGSVSDQGSQTGHSAAVGVAVGTAVYVAVSARRVCREGVLAGCSPPSLL